MLKLLLISLLLSSCNVFKELGTETKIDPNFFNNGNEPIEDNNPLYPDTREEHHDTAETTTTEEQPVLFDYMNYLELNIQKDTALNAHSLFIIKIKNITSRELMVNTSFMSNEGNILEIFNTCRENFLAPGSYCEIEIETYSPTMQMMDTLILNYEDNTGIIKEEFFNIKIVDSTL